MEFYEEARSKIRTYKHKIKDNSIKVYIDNVKKLTIELFGSTKPNVKFFRDHESVLEYFSSISNLASKKTMVTSVVVMLKSYDFDKDITKIYSDFMLSLSKAQNTEYLENRKSEKEDANWITQKEIKKIVKDLKKKTKDKTLTERQKVDTLQQLLVVSLYTELPPVRNDFSFCKILEKIPDNEPDNYINLNTKEFILQQYKTSKFYGKKNIELPDTLFKIIKEFEKLKKEIYGDKIHHNYLLINTTNFAPMNRNCLTKYLNKIFAPRKVSSTILRKAYLSEKYPITHTMQEMVKDADIMCHSLNVAQKVYKKIL